MSSISISPVSMIETREIIDNILGLKDELFGDADKEEEVEKNVTERLFSLMKLDSGR